MVINDGGTLIEDSMTEVNGLMKEFEKKRLAYLEMKKDDTFHADVYEQTEILLMLLNGLYAIYKQNQIILNLLEK